MVFKGVIIEESLSNKSVLSKLKIIKTDVELVTTDYKTPWLKQWTMHTVAIDDSMVDLIADDLSNSLDSEHNWYADFKNDLIHYIIFRGKVFKVNRSRNNEYKSVVSYGLSLGIPAYQLDFSPNIL